MGSASGFDQRSTTCAQRSGDSRSTASSCSAGSASREVMAIGADRALADCSSRAAVRTEVGQSLPYRPTLRLSSETQLSTTTVGWTPPRATGLTIKKRLPSGVTS